mmetsp:Transcript_18235/g.20307  ORF Transcript_18235/g.20307 Transcript_18235/m.20307 type:complete len:89 (+) Transcript_18235:191-457(+)
MTFSFPWCSINGSTEDKLRTAAYTFLAPYVSSNPSTNAFPIPLLAPVIKTTLSFISIDIVDDDDDMDFDDIDDFDRNDDDDDNKNPPE